MMNTSVQIISSPSHVKATKRWAVMSSNDAGLVCRVNEHVAFGLATSLYLFLDHRICIPPHMRVLSSPSHQSHYARLDSFAREAYDAVTMDIYILVFG
jgi:hypothetical protein